MYLYWEGRIHYKWDIIKILIYGRLVDRKNLILAPMHLLFLNKKLPPVLHEMFEPLDFLTLCLLVWKHLEVNGILCGAVPNTYIGLDWFGVIARM